MFLQEFAVNAVYTIQVLVHINQSKRRANKGSPEIQTTKYNMLENSFKMKSDLICDLNIWAHHLTSKSVKFYLYKFVFLK